VPTISRFNSFVASRIEAIADDAYSCCVPTLDEDSQTIIATGLWALATTTLFTVLGSDVIEPPFTHDHALTLINAIESQFDRWAFESGIGDDTETNVERLDDFVGLMVERVFEGELKHNDVLGFATEAVPDLHALLTNDVIGPKLTLPAFRAMYAPLDARNEIVGAWREVNTRDRVHLDRLPSCLVEKLLA
jgi:hypothetical protein